MNFTAVNQISFGSIAHPPWIRHCLYQCNVYGVRWRLVAERKRIERISVGELRFLVVDDERRGSKTTLYT